MTAATVIEDNRRTNRWMRCLAAIVGGLLLIIASAGLVVETAALHSGARQRAILIDCTTAGPNPPPHTGHACYDRGVQGTGDAINDLRRSIDCVALYVTGTRPPACAEVDRRMDEIKAGGDPFSPTPTPPTTGGTP